MPPTDRPDQGSTTTLFPLAPQPGIQRDGTQFAGNRWADGRWTRFQRGLPRKIGGYRSMSEAFQGPIRNVMMYADSGINRLYVGSTTRLEYSDVTDAGIGAGVGDRTPAAFIPSDNNIWTFGELIDGVGGPSKLLAHAAPNLASIASTEMRKTWFGNIDGSDALIDTTAPEVSGGVLSAAPYAIVYGDDGYVANCVPNVPDDWAGAGFNEANITKSKIVFGAQTRGGAGVSPAFLLWSLDSVVRATFAGGAAVFDFDHISTQSSVLSSRAFIEYDGIWIWPGVDRFMMYNGTVQEVPNDQNINWFYDNLNWTYRQKVWATKVPRYGEVWIWFPYGDAVDCNAAIIVNLREGGYWYDTGIGSGATSIYRVHGWFPQVFRWPTWADAEQSAQTTVRISGGDPESSDQPAAETISTITRVTTTATLTTAAPHGLTTGWTIRLTGQTPAQYAGVFNVTVTGASTFTYVMDSDPGGNATVVGTYTVGDAEFAFDGDAETASVQDAADGNISVDFGDGVTKSVSRVGFIPANSTTYNLLFEYSDDNFDNWETLYTVGALAVTAGTLYEYDLLAPVSARGFRMRETGGATLYMTEIYFDNYGYIVHQHEFGVDRVVGAQTLAIPAYIESGDISFVAHGPLGDRWLGVDRWVKLNSTEIDFIQTGDITMTVRGRYFPNAPDIDNTYTFAPGTWKVDSNEIRRQMRLRFTTNTQGGDYQFGQVVLWLEASPDEQRPNIEQMPA